jgi:site-specific DNA recombinase
MCRNSVVRGEELDQAVWAEVCALLQNPSRVQEEYCRRRQKTDAKESVNLLNGLEAQGEKVSRRMARLIDSYAEGLIEKEEFEPRIKRLKQRAAELAQQTNQLAEEQTQQSELQLLMGQLEEFAKQVEHGLESIDPLTRREIIQAVVRQIEVAAEQIRVVFKVSARPFVLSPGNRTWQHCPGRRNPTAVEQFGNRTNHALFINVSST